MSEQVGQGDESGCQVDWSWLERQVIKSVWSNLDTLRIELESGFTLTVKAANWKGQAFLSFDPYHAPA
jgi:hypothetical protein